MFPATQTRNHRRAAESPGQMMIGRENSLTVNQNMAVGERWEIRSLLDLFRRDIMYYEYFNI